MFQPEPSDSEQPKRRWNWVSMALFVIGLLILVPSGLCTTLGLLFALSGPVTRDLPPTRDQVEFVLLFGALPISLGALLVWFALAARERE